MPTKIHYHRCKGRVQRIGDGQVEQLHTQVQLVGSVPHSHKPRFSCALYPRDHTLVLPRHLLLAIQRRSNNHLAPVRVESVYKLDEPVEDNITCMTVMDGDGQEVEVMNSFLMTYADADITVRSRHVRRHVKRKRERPALLKNLQYEL